MDFISLAVIGTSGALAYMNSLKESFTAESASPEKKGASAELARSADFLKVRLATMLSEGTLTDVKAVCKQIEDAGLQAEIPDYSRAQNIIKSVPNPCGKPQIVKDPTRYQNQPLTDFVHNNFVPFYRGRHTQNMAGTGMPSGNWNAIGEGPTVSEMNRVTGNDPFVKPPKSARDPESRVFSVRELGTENVWGTPLIRPELERYVDVTSSRPDLRSTEQIQVGPGMNTEALKSAHQRGFHDFYRPIDDAAATVNSKTKISVEAPLPSKGKFVGAMKTASQIPYAGGLTAALEGFSQDSAETETSGKFQGKGFVVKKCNAGGAVDREQMATTGPGNTRYTGEYGTEQMLRPDTKRDQETVNINTHYPGLQTGEVKRVRMVEGDLQNSMEFDRNVRNYKQTIDRGKGIREGLPSAAMGNQLISGHDSGPGRYYLNENFSQTSSLPLGNITQTAGALGAHRVMDRNNQDASTTNRELQVDQETLKGTYGAAGGRGHTVTIQDEFRTGHRETTNTDTINSGSRNVSSGENRDYEISQRNNLRAGTISEDRPLPARSNELSSVKVRVGSYKLNDLRSVADVSDRPHGNTARTSSSRSSVPKSNTNYNKLLETFSDPRIGSHLAGGYGALPQDSRESCKDGGI